MTAPHEQRVIEEHEDLDGKITRLSAFIGTQAFGSLPRTDQWLLREQLSAMKAYLAILIARIRRFTPEEQQ